MTVTVADLKKHEGERAILRCPACDAQFSATPGDYWDLPDDYQFFCHCQNHGDDNSCGTPMQLVAKQTTYRVLEA